MAVRVQPAAAALRLGAETCAEAERQAGRRRAHRADEAARVWADRRRRPRMFVIQGAVPRRERRPIAERRDRSDDPVRVRAITADARIVVHPGAVEASGPTGCVRAYRVGSLSLWWECARRVVHRAATRRSASAQIDRSLRSW